MLTIFSIPKSFSGHINIIQRNAVKSWKRLQPDAEIILLGTGSGAAEICNELGLIHISELDSNENDTPFLNDAFLKAQNIASNDTVCYVNTDIIFTDKLIITIKAVRKWNDKYLIIGRRSNIEIDNEIDFQNPDWQLQLEETVKCIGNQATPYFIDYFIFPKGLFNDMPPFLVGRAYWDNWFIWNAIDKKIPVVEATSEILAAHQNHDYSHLPNGREGAYEGEEAKHNADLMGGRVHYYSITDANYVLTNKGVKKNLSKEYFVSRYKLFVWVFMFKTKSIRHKLGIRSSNATRLLNIFQRIRERTNF